MKINPSLIIHYFANKDNMTVELVDYMSRIYNKLFLDMKIETSDPQKRLDRLVEIFCSDEWYNQTDISGDYSILTLSFRNKKVFKKRKCLINKSLQTLGYVRKITYLSGVKNKNTKSF